MIVNRLAEHKNRSGMAQEIEHAKKESQPKLLSYCPSRNNG